MGRMHILDGTCRLMIDIISTRELGFEGLIGECTETAFCLDLPVDMEGNLDSGGEREATGVVPLLLARELPSRLRGKTIIKMTLRKNTIKRVFQMDPT